MLVTDLFEYGIHFRDARRAFTAMRRYPNAFVHFSKGITHKDAKGIEQRAPAGPKLGINPRKTHRDPPGIYFYYSRWLMRSDDVSDSQYAVTSDHYWIVDIQKTPNSINLATVRWEKIEALAKRNGWHKALFAVSNDPGKLRQGPMDVRKLRSAGGRFWATMDYIANVSKEHSWLQMLKGVDAIFDPGRGYINANEPAQVIVLNPSIISVIEHGENRDNEARVQADAMKRVAEAMGGTFSFRDGDPSISAEVDGKPVTARLRWGTLHVGTFKNGVWFERERRRDTMQDMEADWFERSLKGALEHLVRYEKAEATGRISAWTEERISAVIGGFLKRNVPMMQHAQPGGVLTYSSGHNGFGSIRFFFRFEATADDTLTASISFSVGYDQKKTQVEAKGVYPVNAEPSEIGADLLRKMIPEINRERREGNLARPDMFIQLSGLRLSVEDLEPVMA